ncbi:hypothetical protein H6A23_06930 [Olsenella uli]|uniref:hypothetical protein n=1 Tax=Olsenella uli TaxID=133926 RepID=UPI00195D34FB|nr:hypothetical protein [Olsenella uli]MBM6816897.1 hypothetical protein [Olsenella uli]
MSYLGREEAARRKKAAARAMAALIQKQTYPVTTAPTTEAGVLALMEAQPFGASQELPPLLPSDPDREKKIALVGANIPVNGVRGTRPKGGGSVTQEEYAAILDALPPDQRPEWYREQLDSAPLGPSPVLMSSAGVPGAVADAALLLNPSGGLAAYSAELSGKHPKSAWLGGGDRASVAGAYLCGIVRGSAFVDVPSLLMEADGRGRFGPGGASRLFSDLKEHSLLVLDGMGVRGWTARNASMLSSVIDSRRKAGLPTAFTAELRPSEIARRVGSEAGRDSGEALSVAIAKSMGRNSAERAAHLIPC